METGKKCNHNVNGVAMKNRYVISTIIYNQCPTCHLGTPGYSLQGFSTIHEIMDFALQNYPVGAVDLIFDNLDGPNYEFFYETGRHCLTGIVMQENGKPVQRTIDNGRGVLIWDEI